MSRKAEITKTFHFEAAHQLQNHKGKCANLHGHSYVVQVKLYGDIEEYNQQSLSEEGMVADFSDVKEVVSPIIEAMDHSFLCDEQQSIEFSCIENGVDEVYARHSDFFGTKLYEIGARTTAENIAWHIMSKVVDRLPFVHSVEVWETETSSAKVYTKDFNEWRCSQN